jgi:hypothetical protein
MTRVRPWVPFAIAVLLILAAGVLLGPSEGGGPPLDPANPKGLGTKGLVEVLRELDADVTISRAPLRADGDTDTAVIFADDLDDHARDAALDFVAAGGTLLLTDPFSPLNPFEVVGGTDVGFLSATIDRECDDPALRDVGRVDASGAVVLAPTGTAVGCFPRNDGAWLVIAPLGEGNLVVAGGAGAFINSRFEEADNAALAAAILAPRPGARVVVVQPPLPGAGESGRSLLDLIAPNVRTALLQLGVAFVFLALWRARRLGRPVLEPQLVELPGSELVVAVGHLLQRANAAPQAAEMLRADLRRDLTDRLGLPPGLAAEPLAAIAASRTNADADHVLSALTRPVVTDTDLVELAQLIEAVRMEVTRAQIVESVPAAP